MRVALGVDMNCGQRARAESLGDGVALFVGFGFLPGLIQRLNQESTIFSVVGLALDGFAERSGRRVEIIGAKFEQAEVEGIVVFVGVEFNGVFEIALSVGRLAFASERESRCGAGECGSEFPCKC